MIIQSMKLRDNSLLLLLRSQYSGCIKRSPLEFRVCTSPSMLNVPNASPSRFNIPLQKYCTLLHDHNTLQYTHWHPSLTVWCAWKSLQKGSNMQFDMPIPSLRCCIL